MATAIVTLKERRRFTIYGWVLPGLAAGMVMAIWSMTVALFASRFWAPPQGIAQTLGIGAQGHDFQLTPTMLGVVIHMANSVVIGAVFVAAMPVLRAASRAAIVGAGLVYGLAVYALMSRLVLHGALSSSSGSFLTSTPEWSSVMAHALFGITLGAVAVVLIRRPDEKPAP